MAYDLITLSQFIDQIGQLLDDTSHKYWTVNEIALAVDEGLLVWGAETSYWRARGTFPVVPGQPPFYALNVDLPTLRPRTITLDQIVTEIQYMLLENPSGIAGTGMSGQISAAVIIQAVLSARVRFLLDAHLPVQVYTTGIAPTDGLIDFDPHILYVHSGHWVDEITGQETPLWREDAWAADKSNILWNLDPDLPLAFSEAEQSPLRLQLIPPPLNVGHLSAIVVSSGSSIPDEWAHAIKYAALAQILSAPSQIADRVRAEYAESRYQQAVEFARQAKSVIRVLLDGAPLPVDTLASMDASTPYWRNQRGRPQVCGILYDAVLINPGKPDRTYGLAVDVIRAAPLPALSGPAADQYIQMGDEDLASLQRYVVHVLTFKCGGNDLTDTYPDYDSFMRAVSLRKAITGVKIKYLAATLGQAQKEESERPDMVPARS